MALPLFKFGILAVRTVSKPVASRLKSYAVDHPIMRSACETTGQIWHRTVTRVNVRLMGHRVSKIKDLPEAEAVTRGADFFGELFVYCVSAGGIMLELWRSGRESKRKEAAKLARRAEKERVWGERLGQLDRQVAVLQEESLATRKLLEEIRQKQEAAAQKKWFSWQ